jgi:AcrR family transcriptional regulator
MSSMNPRVGDPATRLALVEAAARLLAAHGPAALSARRLAAEVGTSTMAIYTHFGSMPDLVRAVVREGFDRLARRLAEVPATDDPVADLANQSRAYRRNALAEPHLYAVMLGGSAVAGFALTDEDRRIGLDTFRVARDSAQRCIDAGRFRPTDPWAVARQLLCLVHGRILLELGGYLDGPPFDIQLRDFAVGAGDTIEAATASVTAPARR